MFILCIPNPYNPKKSRKFTMGFSKNKKVEVRECSDGLTGTCSIVSGVIWRYECVSFRVYRARHFVLKTVFKGVLWGAFGGKL